jgi:glycosyltransferase involved in cell wall biosynthesis
MTRVVHVAAELGQGGTERSIELLATAPQGPASQLVVSLGQDGPTGQRLRAAGVETRTFGGDLAAAAAAIAEGGGAVALLNRSGRPEAKWNELIRRLAAGSVLPLEVNHFGWLDRSAIADGLKGSYCVSGTALAKYLRQMFGHWPSEAELAGAPLALVAGNNPVLAGARPVASKAELRRRFGLPADAFIALRIGRPDARKWSDLMIVHGARLLEEFPRLHFVLLSAPESRCSTIRRVMGDRVSLMAFTTDRDRIAEIMAAADVMLHYARYGESFGYALAEAALAELPVIVQATPWGDNAQAELIHDGDTGFVVGDYAETRHALARLMDEGILAHTMGRRAAADIAERFGVGVTWVLLHAFIAHAARGGRGLLPMTEPLAGDQRARLAAGQSSYGEKHPHWRRFTAERPLYARPWFWRLLALDAASIVRQRLAR